MRVIGRRGKYRVLVQYGSYSRLEPVSDFTFASGHEVRDDGERRQR
jgi:hypothetical protein